MRKFDALRTFEEHTERVWTDEAISVLTAKQLHELGCANQGAVSFRDPTLKRMYEEYGKRLTAADKAAALRMETTSVPEKKAHLEGEEAVQAMSGRIIYSLTDVKIDLPNKQLVRENSPIPVPFVPVKQRPYVQAITPICAQVVEHKSGEWKAKSVASWGRAFGGIIEYSKLQTLGSYVADMLNCDEAWLAMAQTSRSSCTGIHFLTFVRDALNRATDLAYGMIHTMFLIDVLQIGLKVQGKFRYRLKDDGSGKLAIDKSFYEPNPLVLSKEEDATVKRKYPGLYYYKGGYIPQVNVPGTDGTLKKSELVLRRVREVTGGDDTAMWLLAMMKGYSGLTTEAAKRFHFTLSAVAECWRRGKNVDIRLNSSGDVITLVSSLNDMLRKFKELGKAMSGNPFKFINSTNKPLQYGETLRTYFITTHRKDAVAIWHSTASLPTTEKKGVIVNYDVLSEDLIPPGVDEFIAYSPIFGICMFPNDEKAISERKTHSVSFEKKKDVYVYAFGNTAKFTGIISSMTDLQLTGWGFPQSVTAGKVMEDRRTAMTLVPVELKRVMSEKEWYEQVALDATAVLVSVFKTVGRYSPISNWFTVSKEAVLYKKVLLSDQDEQYIQRNISVSKKRQLTGEVMGDEMVAPPSMDGDEQEVSYDEENLGSAEGEDDSDEESGEQAPVFVDPRFEKNKVADKVEKRREKAAVNVGEEMGDDEDEQVRQLTGDDL